MNLTGNNLTEFPINLISKHTKVVDLSNNQIEALPKAELLKEFTQLNNINLNNNLIKYVIYVYNTKISFKVLSKPANVAC